MNRAFENVLKRNEELVADNMLKSSRISELEQELERLQSAVRVVMSQAGHNKCFVWELWLHSQLKDGSPAPEWPDPGKVPIEEFLMGCTHYAPTLFVELGDAEKELLEKLRLVLREYKLKIAEIG